MYFWTGYSNTNGENDRCFFNHYNRNSIHNGLKDDTVIKVYANEGEKIKFATSGTGFEVTKPEEKAYATISVTQTNGSEGFFTI